jgi:hypothetical protein
MGLVIWLFIQHPRLKSAVRDLFGDTEPLESADLGTLAGGQTVVTTTRDISTKECAALAGRGVKVIVLGTGLPGAGEREYLEAGAYLFQEMNLRAGKLADWILTVTPHGNGPWQAAATFETDGAVLTPRRDTDEARDRPDCRTHRRIEEC